MDALDLTTGERLSGMKFLAKGSRRKAAAPQRRQHDEGEPGVENRDEMIQKTETSSLNGNDDDLDDGVETPPRPSSEGSARPVDIEMEQPSAKPAFLPTSNLLGEFAQKILAVRTELARTNSPLYDRDRHFPLNVNNNSNSPADSPDINSVDSESRQSDITPRPPSSNLLPFPLIGHSGLAVDDLMQQRLRRYLNDVQPAEAPGIPERTKKQNRWAFNVWREWARKRNSLEDSFTGPYKGVPLDVGQASEEELDYWLCKFVMEIRRKDGNPYPPHTLMQIVMGIQRYLRQQAGKPTICILDRSNATYTSFRSVLDYRIKELTNNGATSLKTRYRPALLGNVDDKYGKHFRKGAFPGDNFNWKDSIMDTDTAQGLLNAVFWHNYKSFGIQYIDDHWNLRAENFQIHGKSEGNGVSILEFTPSVNSMMAASGKVNGMRVMPKKLYSDNPEDHEVFAIYQKYLSHIPQTGPFYRHPVDPTIVDRSIKFSDQWVGKNRLRAMLKHLLDVGVNNRLKTGYSNSNRHISRSVDKFVTPMMQLSSGPLNFPPASLQGNVDIPPKSTMQPQNQQRNQSSSVTSKEIDDESYGDSDSGPPSPKRTKSDTQADTRIGSSSTNGSTRSRNASNDDAALEIAVPKTIKSITVVKGGRKITFHLD